MDGVEAMDLHEHLFHLIPPYALRSLDDQETSQVRQHLSACAECQAELRAYENTLALLPTALPQSVPSDALRARILTGLPSQPLPERVHPLEIVSSKKTASESQVTDVSSSWWHKLFRWNRPLWLAPAFALIGVILVLAVNNMLLREQLNGLQSQANELQTQVNDLQSQLIDTDMIVVPLFADDANPMATGVIIMDPNGAYGTIVVNALPPSKEGEQYQVWLSKNDQVDSGGTFTIWQNGYGAQIIYAPDHLLSYTQIWVTVEPQGGSEHPAGEIVLRNGP